MDLRVQAVGKVYEFDDVRVEPARHRLLKAGRAIAVEPKLYAVLLEFLERPGLVITRDELLDAVWGHQHVTPAALSRVVAMLRKHLGDTAEDSRYIQTVHTLGYRFIAAVRVSTLAPEAGTASNTASAVEAPPVAGSASEATTISDEGGAPDQRVSGNAGRSSPRRTDIIFKHWTLAALALVAAILGVWAAWRTHIDAGPASLPARTVTLAVLPLTAPAGDEELRTAAEGFSESLIERLARVSVLRVTGRESAFAVGSAGSASPKQTAETLGVENVLSGKIEPKGSDLHLRLDMWRRGAVPVETIVDQQVPRTQLFRSLSHAAEQVQVLLINHSLPTADNSVALSAQDLYVLGRHYWNEQSQPSLLRALDYFERAVAVDPHYALAYCGLVETYSQLEPSADLSGEQMSEKAHIALAQAKLLAPDSADVFAAEGVYYSNQNDHAKALPAFKRALDREPRHPIALSAYSFELGAVERIDEAIESLDRALEFEPLNTQVRNELAQDYIIAGNEEMATREIQRVLDIDPDNAEAYNSIGWQHLVHGRTAAAAMAYVEAQRLRAGYSGVVRAYLQAGATDLAENALPKDPRADDSDYLDDLGFIRMAQGRFAETLLVVEAKCPGPDIVFYCSFTRARLLALLGRRDEARTLYTSLYADKLDSGERPVRAWYSEFYRQHFAAWLALLPVGSSQRNRGIEFFGAQLERMTENGVRAPVMDYERAILAALKGDADAARSHLDAAIAAGWLNAPAIDRDLVWQPYAKADWLLAARQRIAAHAASEREQMQVASLSN